MSTAPCGGIFAKDEWGGGEAAGSRYFRLRLHRSAPLSGFCGASAMEPFWRYLFGRASSEADGEVDCEALPKEDFSCLVMLKHCCFIVCQ